VDATVEYEQLRRQSKDDEDEEEDRLDDSKVYQQLLKDFVAHSTAAANGNGVGRLQVSKSAQNKKKQVDRRASKGRKIRYKEIPKLVNFTFPLSRPNSSNLDQDEWFQSLFGGAGKM
jgi:protein AATF/BFR2